MGAADDNPVCPGLQNRNQNFPDRRHEFRRIEAQGIHLISPAGTGQDVDHDILCIALHQTGRRTLRAVSSVLSTAIRPLRELAAAGFTPGSTPITVIVGRASRNRVIAAAVAVLQATTINEHPRATK